MNRILTSIMIGVCAASLAGCKKSPPPPPPPTVPPVKASTVNTPPQTTHVAPTTMPTPSPRPTAVTPTTAPASAPATTSAVAPNAPLRPDLAAPANDKVASFLGLAGPKPATWVWHPPQGMVNVAEYTVPGVEGADLAKITVSAVGGSIQANIDRWKGQFRDSSGTVGAVEPKVSTTEVGDMDVTLVELDGEYRGMGMTNYAADQVFLTAIVQAPGNQIFVKLVGPRKTVEANRDAFMNLIKGLHKVEPEK